MELNNENSFASQLPQPSSRIPSPGKLREMTTSHQNVRSSAMLPPQSLGKRKNLIERAGEPAGRPAPAAPSSRPPSATGRPNPLAGVSRHSFYSMRPPSVTSLRNVSNNALANSVEPGHRAPSSQTYRPQSAMADPRSQRNLQDSGRPLTAMEGQSIAPGKGRVGRRPKRMPPFSLSPNGIPNGPKEVVRHGSDSSGGTSNTSAPRSIREISLSSAMSKLRLDESTPQPTSAVGQDVPTTPSQIPKYKQSLAPLSAVPQRPFPLVEASSPCKSPQKTPKPLPKFLTRDSNTVIAWDMERQVGDLESISTGFKEQMSDMFNECSGMKDLIAMYRSMIEDLEQSKTHLQSSNATLQLDLDAVKAQVASSSAALEDSKRQHNIKLDDIQRQHRRDLDDAQRDKEEDIRRQLRSHQDELDDMKRQLQDALEEEKSRRQREILSLASEGAMSQQKLEVELETQQKVVKCIQDKLQQSQAEINQERRLNSDLRAQLSEAATNALKLESCMSSLRAHITFLESDNKSQSQAFADLEMRMQNAIRSAAEANEKLRTEETLRRKLHNQVQELKGNIRVFCRVRPPIENDSEAARIKYPDIESDSKEVEVQGQPEKSSLGTITTKTNTFAFDRVFGPKSANADVFGEISQLVQSALDGYNVCIFCYGQTGSGKTYTMSSTDGMIPLAVNQIYDTAKSLEEKGWKYTMEGSFVEVYNENLNDLLGKADELDKKKHEIRHDMQRCKTTITDITVVDLDTPNKVESILRRASANRSVAATNANERSSRSHSVFILKLIGDNSVTGERSEGTLNLVDLAGSERLSHSGATGERLKETQSINKSLSCLGDVIGALGQGKEGGHVPYRNSKLTYLLQFSLGGNSKTLMFVMISPLQAHLSETLTSLKFATKVHNTHIGTAKRQAKTKD